MAPEGHPTSFQAYDRAFETENGGEARREDEEEEEEEEIGWGGDDKEEQARRRHERECEEERGRCVVKGILDVLGLCVCPGESGSILALGAADQSREVRLAAVHALVALASGSSRRQEGQVQGQGEDLVVGALRAAVADADSEVRCSALRGYATLTACGDEEVIKLLGEVIDEGMDGGYLRATKVEGTVNDVGKCQEAAVELLPLHATRGRVRLVASPAGACGGSLAKRLRVERSNAYMLETYQALLGNKIDSLLRCKHGRFKVACDECRISAWDADDRPDPSSTYFQQQYWQVPKELEAVAEAVRALEAAEERVNAATLRARAEALELRVFLDEGTRARRQRLPPARAACTTRLCFTNCLPPAPHASILQLLSMRPHLHLSLSLSATSACVDKATLRVGCVQQWRTRGKCRWWFRTRRMGWRTGRCRGRCGGLGTWRPLRPRRICSQVARRPSRG
jgi:hypothetical protein